MPSSAPSRLIEECRRKHEAARATGVGPGASSAALDLFQRGRAVWGAIVMANSALYEPGRLPLPGCIAMSFDPWFDDNVDELAGIASAAFELRGTVATDPALSAFAGLVKDDYARPANHPIPRSLTSGRVVYYQLLQFVRERLPTGYLVHQVVPVIAGPGGSSPSMLLPLECWADELIAQWSKLAAGRRPPGVGCPAAIDLGEFMTNPLTISPATAAEVRKIVSVQHLRTPSLRVTEEHGAYGLDITDERPNPARDFSYESQGMRLVIDRNCARSLMGIEVDFVTSTRGRGFTFRRRAS